MVIDLKGGRRHLYDLFVSSLMQASFALNVYSVPTKSMVDDPMGKLLSDMQKHTPKITFFLMASSFFL